MTLLDHTRVIPWAGMQVEVAVSQYVAFLGGRIHEVAYDLYAQDDDGNVWYFGEDVYNCLGGAIGDTHGTWIAGVDGPAAMIMPADPQPGRRLPAREHPRLRLRGGHRQEDRRAVPGAVRRTGPAQLVISELHMDGGRERKTFAPAYGEFFTSGGGDTEALALAVPTDAVEGALPAPVRRLIKAATVGVRRGHARRPRRGRPVGAAASAAWTGASTGGDVPRLLRPLLARAVQRLDAADGQDAAAQAAIDVARLAQDLRLRYATTDARGPAPLRHLARADAARRPAQRPRAVRGDFFAIDYVRDRVRDSFGERHRAEVDLALEELLDAINDDDLATVREVARELRSTIR